VVNYNGYTLIHVKQKKNKEKLMEGMPEICGLNHAAAKLFQGHPEIWDSTMVVL
jgi:hypothetical protein